MTGHGKIVYTEKQVKEGQMKNAHLDGFGTCHYAHGTTYIGFWKNNLRHGYGIFKTNCG